MGPSRPKEAIGWLRNCDPGEFGGSFPALRMGLDARRAGAEIALHARTGPGAPLLKRGGKRSRCVEILRLPRVLRSKHEKDFKSVDFRYTEHALRNVRSIGPTFNYRAYSSNRI